MDQEVIRALTPSDGQKVSHLCPHLTSLNIRVKDRHSEKELGAMIESRLTINPADKPSTALKAIRVDFESDELPTESLMDRFDRLGAKGLSVTYKQLELPDTEDEDDY